MITGVENYIIVLDPFLAHCMGPLSLAYEAIRDFNGQVFARAGRGLYALLHWWNKDKARGPLMQRHFMQVPQSVASVVRCMCSAGRGLHLSCSIELRPQR
jgi:hypothetical protein